MRPDLTLKPRRGCPLVTTAQLRVQPNSCNYKSECTESLCTYTALPELDLVRARTSVQLSFLGPEGNYLGSHVPAMRPSGGVTNIMPTGGVQHSHAGSRVYTLEHLGLTLRVDLKTLPDTCDSFLQKSAWKRHNRVAELASFKMR